MYILSSDMSAEAFNTFKAEILACAIKMQACQNGLEAHNSATTPQEWLDKCGKYLRWLANNGIDIKLEGFTHCGSDLNLVGYGFALPKSFTHCGGWPVFE